MEERVIKAITSFTILSILVVGVSMFLVFEAAFIGPAYLILGGMGILFLKFFKINVNEVYPDMIFGLIDNGVLVFTAVLGGIYAGVAGAILGGAAGNTITDGLGGFFEGRIAEKLRRGNKKIKRNALSTMLGKMTGCLFGAGLGLTIVWGIKIILDFL